jgi:hypothetical protein
MNTEQPYPPMMPQAPQPVFHQPPYPPTRPVVARYKGQKIRIAFYATLLFLALSHIGAYRIVNMVYNAITSQPHEVVNEQGEPTIKGLLLHGIIFFLGVMFLLA